MHLGHLRQHLFPMRGYKLAGCLHHLAGCAERQLHSGGLSRSIHPVYEAFTRQNGSGGHRNVALSLGSLFQPDGQLLAASALFRTNGLANWSLSAIGQSGTFPTRPSMTVACPQARKRFKFLNRDKADCSVPARCSPNGTGCRNLADSLRQRANPGRSRYQLAVAYAQFPQSRPDARVRIHPGDHQRAEIVALAASSMPKWAGHTSPSSSSGADSSPVTCGSRMN